MTKTYVVVGNETLLGDEFGELRLVRGQKVDMDEERAKVHIEAGAPLELFIDRKETP